jgi:hypothetical protein
MAKLQVIPDFNSNFFRAMYLGVLFALFKVCLDIGMILWLGARLYTMILVSSLVAMLTFSYVVYLILELQDEHESPKP